MKRYVDAEAMKKAIVEAVDSGLATTSADLAEIIDELQQADTTSSEKIPYKKTCKKKEWEEILLPSEYEALNGVIYTSPEDEMTSNEVLDAIVDYKGGVTSGYEIRSIISRVYGVELG